MRSVDGRIPLVTIIGPTAVGKTEISLRVAEKMGGEIVSADSRLFYRGMDIGTAKPSMAERARVPHHLIDVANPDERWSLTIFQESAARVIAEIHSRGKLALLVGGTGQYLRAVTEGWLPPPQPPDERLRTALEAWAGDLGAVEIHRRLAIIDPAAAANIEVPNVRRTIRALEVVFSTGQRFSTQRGRGTPPYDLIQIGLTRPRPELYQRIDARINAMLDNGFEAEVRRLLAAGYTPELSTLSAIGYREMVAYIRGEMSLADAVVLMKRLTRRYVRQQYNWFSLENDAIHWFSVQEGVENEICALINAWLEKKTPGE
jgi:tRNA dimethylallyltransferase